MIECTDKKVYYKKNRRRKPRRFFSFIIFNISIIICFFYLRYGISTQISNICEEYTYSYCTESVNEAVIFSLTDTLKYEDLINIEKDSKGSIVLLSANSLKVNYVCNKIASYSEKFLDEKINRGIPIPLMAFSGLRILSGYGKTVYFKALTITSVKCAFRSEFTSQGINQTLHSIYADITCEYTVNIPLNANAYTFTHGVLISESVLVGSVPEVYFNGSIFR